MKNKYHALNDVQMDFSEYEECALSELEVNRMKENIQKKVNQKKLSWKKGAIIAACIAVSLTVISQTAFAKNIINGIIQSVSTGHNKIVKVDPDYVPELIDKQISTEYDEDGAHIIEYADGSSVMVTYAGDNDEQRKDSHLYVTENEIANYTNFVPQLPSYLPAGYTFDTAYFVKDNNGNASGDYLFVEYKNGEKKFTIHERIINDETAYEDGAIGEIEELTINGNHAALYDNTITWETNGISVEILAGQCGFDRTEILKIAESVK